MAMAMIMITIIIVAMTVVLMFSTMVIPTLFTAFFVMFAMLFLITWDVFMIVPVVPDKIDPLAAGVIFAAMFSPVFGMAWRYAQIDRRALVVTSFDYHRLAVDHLGWWIVANVELAIKAGLANVYGYTNVGSECRGGHGGSGGGSHCHRDQ